MEVSSKQDDPCPVGRGTAADLGPFRSGSGSFSTPSPMFEVAEEAGETKEAVHGGNWVRTGSVEKSWTRVVAGISGAAVGESGYGKPNAWSKPSIW